MLPAATTYLTTPRLTLKPMEDADFPGVLAILTHPEVVKSYMVPELTVAQAEALFSRLKTLSHDGAHFVRGIYWQERLVGFLNDTEITGEYLELGWVIHPDFHNRGFATEAVRAAISALLASGVPAVLAGAFDWNTPSIRVMEKCGMTRMEKTDTIEYRGKTHTCVYYRISS